VLHWNGHRLSWVFAPNPGSQNELHGIVATSSTDVWAVGSYEDSVTGNIYPLILHWNGTIWSQM